MDIFDSIKDLTVGKTEIFNMNLRISIIKIIEQKHGPIVIRQAPRRSIIDSNFINLAYLLLLVTCQYMSAI